MEERKFKYFFNKIKRYKMWECIFSDIEKEADRQKAKKEFIHNKQVSLSYWQKKGLVKNE